MNQYYGIVIKEFYQNQIYQNVSIAEVKGMFIYMFIYRVFEFQVMPQILYYLDLNIGKDSDTLQFGTLCVYTCSKNCISSESAYLEEFIYCQPAEDI